MQIVATQELNTNDVEKLLKETNQLQETLNNLAALKQSLEQTAYEKEIMVRLSLYFYSFERLQRDLKKLRSKSLSSTLYYEG